MARTIEFGDEDDDRTVHEDGTSYRRPPEATSHELAELPKPPKVSRTQARAAANMRYSGAPWDEIARMLDYKDAAVARQVVEAHIAKAYPDETRESLFRLTDIRLEQLLRGVWSKAQPMVPARDPDDGSVVKDHEGKVVMVDNPDQIAYTKMALDIVGRKAKLHGLDAPTRVEISPDQEKLSAVLDAMVASSGKAPAPEADLFADVEDAEVVEEGELDD